MQQASTTSRGRNTLAGCVAGFIAGLVTAWMLAVKGGLADGFFALEPTKYGAFWQVAVATALGATLGALFERYRGAYAAEIAGGVLVGLLWWIVGPLTLLPLVSGEAPTWTLDALGATFPLLIALVVAGGFAGLLSYVGLLVWLRRRPEIAHAVAGPEPVRIVILGGGFGGVACAQRMQRRFLSEPHVEITLVSQSNYLLFTPMLAEVASSSLQASNISAPVRASAPRVRFRRAEIEHIDVAAREVAVYAGEKAPAETLRFDHLVLGLGATPRFFASSVEAHAFTLKTLEDASRLRDHVLTQLELAEVEPDPARRREMLCFVVVGGGFAGTELIAELFDLVHSVGRLFPHIAPDELRFVLVHSRDRILPELSPELADYAMKKLRDRGIEFVLGKRAAGAGGHAVTLDDDSEIPTRTLVWTAGNQPNPLLADLGLELDRGAVVCDAAMRVTGPEGIWALGDCARVPDPAHAGEFYPPTAQHALRQGKVLADNVWAVLHSQEPEPFRFKTIGVLVALGHRTAAAEIYGRRFSGLLAWFLWRSIYLSKLPGLEKKTRVLFDWTLDMLFPRDIVLEAPPRERDVSPADSEPAS